MKIAEIVAMDDHVLFVETEDGTTGLFDLKPYLSAEAFVPLRQYQGFAAIHNGRYFVEWACGADLSADTIEASLAPAPPEVAQQLAKDRIRNK